ncbi:MAG TPA: HEAT repeat domain-containing protein [Pirellulales bacterium]|jgi:putative heme-binding domain-containing protein|nr:HEAT repeat domain-containing protein [Pirellulales bacterium]
MPHRFLLAFSILWATCLCCATVRADEPQHPPSLVAPSEPLTPEEQLEKFHLPAGFAIQLVAHEGEIDKPMNLNFDGQGRLYVTSSLEYPFPAEDGKPRRDALRVLTDIDGDGRIDKVERLADELNIPIGVTPIAGGAIYYSIPNIYLWQGDAARPATLHGGDATVLYREFGFRDTHGMANSFTRWIDGWIYCCHGFSNTSEVRGADDSKFVMQSGNTFRMRADGSHAEPWTHGQVNPFGLCFDPLGNLYSADCHTLPIYQLLRNAWYPSFGKPHDGLGFGPTMIGHDHGSTGIAGVVYYAADHFPPEYRDTVYIGNPVTGRVNHDRLVPHGSLYQAIEQPDFVSCDDPWFRPVDLKLGPDGALYILDFYNCIIGHYEVPLTHPRRDRERGRIWRVVYHGDDGRAPPPRRMPDLTQQSVEQLLGLLADANLTVRVLATEELAARGDEIKPADLLPPFAEGEPNAWRRAHGLWLYERLVPRGLDAASIERLADDPSRLVRVHLLKALAERCDWSAGSLDLAALVRGKLGDADAFVRRAAADALGRHPLVENVEPLLALWKRTPGDDTHLEHVARMALRDHLIVAGMYAKLAELTAGDADARALLADVSLGVHKQASAAYLFDFISSRPVDAGQMATYLHEVARYLPDDKLPAVYEWTVAQAPDDPLLRRELALALHHAAQERGAALAGAIVDWATDAARRLLVDGRQPQVLAGIDLARELRLADLYGELTALAAADSKFGELRPAAIDACLATDGERSIGLLSAILGGEREEASLRQKAAAALASVNDESAHQELVTHLRAVSDRLALTIAAGLAQRTEGAELLLAEVAAGKASPRLLQEPAVVERLRALKLEGVEERLAALTADLPPADLRIAQLIAERRDGFGQAQPDVSAGRAVFQKTCAACHRLAGEGGKVGPELDGIGRRGIDRILEDLLDPSRNVDQAFRSTVVNTTGGNTLSGLVLREEGQVLILADDKGNEVRLPLDEVEERAVTRLSPMPGNVADLLPEADFLNLVAFLVAQSEAPSPSPKTQVRRSKDK